MGLGKYFSKRHFDHTPEPKGAGRHRKSKRLVFVVQEHHASSLHYDFRLEMDGVLKSWAVPKGPSMNPHDRHLAIMTEDHPYEYRTFEGVIPDGQYGAGNVIVWDEGWYEPRAETGTPQQTLLRELEQGHITFILHGKKLHGEFALIRFHGPQADEKSWLLIKKGDAYASEHSITAEQPASVASGKKVDELHGRVPAVTRYPAKAHPWTVSPMLATLIEEPFSRDGWLFEIKWDGYRAIGSKKGGDVTLHSRAGTNFAHTYTAVAEALHDIAHDVIVDGEIVVVDGEGRAHFNWLQDWRQDQHGTIQYYIFDLIWYDGHDIRTMPLQDRKSLLRHIIPITHGVLRFSDHITGKGLDLFAEMQQRGMEGMVAKQADSPYREGVRGTDWLKIKTQLRQEVVIGGYTEPRGGRKYLGSLLVGVYDNNALIYAGHSGGGLPDEVQRELRGKLAKLERTTSPFHHEPKPNAPVHWVTPQLVCEMSFSEWTEDGRMRHPQFAGMRPDKAPSSVHREQSANKPFSTASQSGHTSKELPFEFTHPDKIFFPKHGYTKQDLFDYYTSVATYILPYLYGRPCSLLRMPHGITGESFFQKNNDHLPAWVPSADIFSESHHSDLHWMVGNDLRTLLYMVQLGCVEINPWSSQVQHLDKPDWTVIDLDPEGVQFAQVITVAQTVHAVCEEWGIPTYPKTSGKTGLHIYIPLHAAYTYEQGKNLAHLIALEVHNRLPHLTSVERMPEKRKHRIYLDFLQNREGQTLAAPYSVRPTPEATVSMPLQWEEVTQGLSPGDFTIKTALKRLQRTGDLWQPVLQKGVNLRAVLTRIEHQPDHE